MVITTTRQKIGLIIGGILIILILLEIGLRVGGFVLLSMQRSENRMTGFVVSDGQDEVYRILTLGESMTADSMGHYPWPRQLEKILNNRSSEIKFEVFNEAVGGTDITYLLTKLKKNLNMYDPDMVIAMVGVVGFSYNINLNYEENLIARVDMLLGDIRVYKLGKLILAAWKKKLKDYEIIRFANAAEDIILNRSFTGERENWNVGEYDKAEEMLKKAIEINPENEGNYIELAQLYRNAGEYDKTEEMLKKAIEINPENGWNYIELMQLYLSGGEYDKTEEMGKKAIEINPESENAYIILGLLYRGSKEYDKAEEMFKKVLEINPRNYHASVGLGLGYKFQGEYDKAEEMFKKALEINPGNKNTYTLLGTLYRGNNEYDKAEEMFKKAGLPFNFDTKVNGYKKLYEILNKQGIKYVAMQYPLLDVDELKLMFDGDEDIIFVSNEENFKEALENGNYGDYFIDSFAGSFGHSTVKGNKLIAENVANVILKELGIIK